MKKDHSKGNPVKKEATGQRRPLIWKEPVALLLFCFLLYGQTLPYDFAHDDIVAIKGNRYTQQGFAGIPSLFTTNFFAGFYGDDYPVDLTGGRYRPLSQVAFAVETGLFGLTPKAGHFFNLIWYFLSSLLVFVFLRKLLPRSPTAWFLAPAFLATLVFLAHPIHTEVVANIKGRDEIMAFVLSMGALWVALFSARPIWLKAGLAALLFFLALLSKENSLAFLILIPTALFVFKPEKPGRETLFITLALLAFSLIFLVIRQSVLGEASGKPPENLMDHPFLGMENPEKYATIFLTLLLYLKLLVFPHPLTWDYYPFHIQPTQWNNPVVWIAVTAYAGLILLVVIGLRRRHPLGWAVLFFLSTLFIVSNLLVSVGVFMAERFLFFPSFALIFALAWGLTRTVQQTSISRPLTSRIIPALTLTLVLFFGARTIARNPVWKDNFTLYTHDVAISPGSAKSNNFAGQQYAWKANQTSDPSVKEQYFQKAEAYLRKALVIYPDYKEAMFYLGNVRYDHQKDYRATFLWYRKILKDWPGDTEVFKNIERLMSAVQNDQAKTEFLEAILPDHPNRFDVHFWLGALYAGRNEYAKAIPLLSRAIELQPADKNPYNYLGVIRYQEGNYQEARHLFRQSLSLDSSDPTITSYLAAAEQMLGNRVDAASLLEKAAKLRTSKTP